MSAPRRPARWPVVAALVLSAAAIATLWWLRGRIAAQEAAVLDNAVRVVAGAQVLGQPEDRSLRFSDLEALAASLEQADLVRRIVVEREVAGEAPRVVHPFALELVEPDWREALGPWAPLPVVVDGTLLGTLHFDIDRSARRAVDAGIGGFLALFLLFLGLLVARGFGKERALGAVASELEKSRAQVIRLERLALAGQLSANLLHDLRKPVLNIRHAVRDGLDGGEAHRDLLAEVAAQTDLFLELLRETGFENFVRSGGEAEEYCDLKAILDRALRLVSYEQGEAEVLRGGDAPPLVLGRPHRLVQLASNLVLNAFQACPPEGGRVWVECGAAEDGAWIAIEDNGPGIAPADRERLFQPFFTTKGDEGGSGLGLYICAGIVEDLGGRLEVEPGRHGSGARFRAWIPAASDQP